MNPIVIAVVGALLGAIWVVARRTSARATPIDPDDPIWREAVARARATLPVLLQLHAEGHDVWVKFLLARADAAREHVWGRVLGAEADTLRCTVETPPIAASGPAETTIRVDDLEDWQVQLEGGSIRGGFTTRAQARISARDGARVPRHVRDQIARMLD